MNCPGCHAELLCDCIACVSVRDGEDTGRPMQISHKDRDLISCPLCGYAGARDAWKAATPVPDHCPD